MRSPERPRPSCSLARSLYERKAIRRRQHQGSIHHADGNTIDAICYERHAVASRLADRLAKRPDAIEGRNAVPGHGPAFRGTIGCKRQSVQIAIGIAIFDVNTYGTDSAGGCSDDMPVWAIETCRTDAPRATGFPRASISMVQPSPPSATNSCKASARPIVRRLDGVGFEASTSAVAQTMEDP